MNLHNFGITFNMISLYFYFNNKSKFIGGDQVEFFVQSIFSQELDQGGLSD